jgi:hypothetical protein
MLPLEPHQRRAPPGARRTTTEHEIRARAVNDSTRTRNGGPTGYKRKNFRKTRNIRAKDAGGAYKAAQGAVGADTQPDVEAVNAATSRGPTRVNYNMLNPAYKTEVRS